ncbi:MAG: hypothetical protein ACK5DE_03150 [Bacteroidota bacterium]|jgi:hypothetical protein
MGLRDRIARALATGDIEKAPRLPAGSVSMTEAEMRAQADALNMRQTYGNSIALPRAPFSAQVPFGPGLPITPGAINPLQDTGRPQPRRYEYQVAQNINVTETRLIPFKTLRAAADQIDILRRCIEVTKSKMVGLEWDIVLGQDASEKITAESGGDHVRAMARAREKYTEEINRLREFWETPDKQNGLTWNDWLNIALEDILVIDAWAVYPLPTVGGDLFAMQILDGSTIKPLIDDRGMRPMPPNAAYQQILYGFPRSEFSATDEDPKADGEFTSDQLAYMVRNRRTISVYGYSPTERALPLADIYLRRQQWLRAEYTDGVLPELMFTTDEDWGNNPDLLRAYENILNDDLAGQTEQRKRARLLPKGLTPVVNEGYGEKFKDTLDDYLITSICGHFGVQPGEIGFAPKGGLGGAGYEEGRAETAEAIGIAPLATWLSKMITNLSYTYLGMPRELEFRLMTSKRMDNESMARKADIEVKSAGKTINERRSEMGLPLLDTPQADMPMLVAGSDIFLFSPEGIINAKEVVSAPTLQGPDATPTEPTTPAIGDAKPEEPTPEEASEVEEEVDEETRTEVKAFMKWVSKGKRARAFEFKTLDPIVGEALNRCAFDGDIDTARALAKAYLT